MIKINHVYPLGGGNTTWEPLHLEVTGFAESLSDISIQGRTWTRDGATVKIFYKKEEMESYNYDYHDFVPCEETMATDVVESIKIIFELFNKTIPEISGEQFLSIMEDVRRKCESRYGNELPNFDYEVLVIFK